MPKTPEYIIIDRFTGFALDSATGLYAGDAFVYGETGIIRNPSAPAGTYVITAGHYGYINDPNNDGNLEDPPIFPESTTDSVGNPILVPDPRTFPPGSGGGGGGGGGDGSITGGGNAVLEDTVGSAILYPEGGGIKSDGPLCALDSVRSCLFQGSRDSNCDMNKIMLHGLNGGILLDEYDNAPATSIMWPAVRGSGMCGEPTDRIMDIGNADTKFNWVHGFKFVVYGTSGTDAGMQPENDDTTELGTTDLKFKKIWANKYHFDTTGSNAAHWGGSFQTEIKAALDNLASRVYNLENSTALADHAQQTSGVHGL